MIPQIVFSDFDGTLTDGPALGPILFDVVELLKKKNIPLIITSGRSVSWGHFFLTHLPLQSCIMEGGGVITYKDSEGHIQEEYLVKEDSIREIENLTQKLMTEIPEVKNMLSKDSKGRVVDRALELSLLEKDGNDSSLEGKILDFFKKHHIRFSKSSVHLNFWLADISKSQAIVHFLKERYPKTSIDDCLYFGDAPNDEDVFAFMKNSVGVSNLSRYKDQLNYLPTVILEGEENRGPYGVYNYLTKLWEK